MSAILIFVVAMVAMVAMVALVGQALLILALVAPLE
jgi:hypothetical protein